MTAENYTTRSASGVRVIAYRQGVGLLKRVEKWHCTIPGVVSPGCSLSHALGQVVGHWDGKTLTGNWRGGELTELTNEQFAALDADDAEGTLFWLARL